MKRIVFILFAFVFSCESTKKVEKEIFSHKIGYEISDEGNKIPLYSNSKSSIQVGKIILKLIMKKIRRPFVNWMQQIILKFMHQLAN